MLGGRKELAEWLSDRQLFNRTSTSVEERSPRNRCHVHIAYVAAGFTQHPQITARDMRSVAHPVAEFSLTRGEAVTLTSTRPPKVKCSGESNRRPGIIRRGGPRPSTHLSTAAEGTRPA
jgi:hypothetical protein